MPHRIVPCLWFDREAEEAARFYTSIFDNSRIVEIAHYPEDSPRPAATVMVVEFELNGERFTALNGGAEFTFNEAISLQVVCETQEEIDYYWERLSDGGEEGQCGWLKDRYGVSWQVAPTDAAGIFSDADPERAARAMQAMRAMRKLDLAQLWAAAVGRPDRTQAT
jgi:predicted 3-demethylubiquinone-9 3-methyltransferase (glyoxalase superfamily)